VVLQQVPHGNTRVPGPDARLPAVSTLRIPANRSLRICLTLFMC